jgi:hypothetical protein
MQPVQGSGTILSYDHAIASLAGDDPRVGLLHLNPSKGKNSHQQENHPFKQFLLGYDPAFLQRYVIAYNNCKRNRLLLKGNIADTGFLASHAP